jgi:hypothetical protein
VILEQVFPRLPGERLNSRPGFIIELNALTDLLLTASFGTDHPSCSAKGTRNQKRRPRRGGRGAAQALGGGV